VDRGYLKGMAPATYELEGKITGAQVGVVTVLARVLRQEARGKRIKGERWYAGYVEVAPHPGLLYPDFDPDVPAPATSAPML